MVNNYTYISNWFKSDQSELNEIDWIGSSIIKSDETVSNSCNWFLDWMSKNQLQLLDEKRKIVSN